MTQNHHTPIVKGSAANASTFNNPDGELDLALTNVIAGDLAINQLNFGALGSAIIISAGAITVSKTYALVDTSGGAANLDTINGGSAGDMLIIQINNVANPVTVRHNTGNIFLSDATNRLLAALHQSVILFYDGTKWVDDYRAAIPATGINISDTINTAQTAGVQDVVLPYRSLKTSGPFTSSNTRKVLDMIPGFRSRITRQMMAQSTGIAGSNVTPVVTSPTAASLSNKADGPYCRISTSNVSGNQASVASQTSNIVELRHGPICYCKLQTPTNSNVSIYIAIGNGLSTVDAPAGTGQLIGFRFATPAGDTKWQAWTSDNTNATLSDTGVTVSTNTTYELLWWYDVAAATAYFSVNSGTPIAITTTLFSTAQDLGLYATVLTRAAAQANLDISRLCIEHD